jgi:hypothetical protein
MSGLEFRGNRYDNRGEGGVNEVPSLTRIDSCVEGGVNEVPLLTRIDLFMEGGDSEVPLLSWLLSRLVEGVIGSTFKLQRIVFVRL